MELRGFSALQAQSYAEVNLHNLSDNGLVTITIERDGRNHETFTSSGVIIDSEGIPPLPTIKENDEIIYRAVSNGIPVEVRFWYRSEKRYGATVVNDSCQKASEDLFNKKISLVKPDYFVISVYEPVFTPQWAYTYAQRNNLPFVKAFFQPENPNQPVLIIYQFPDDFSPVEPGIAPIPVLNNTNITSDNQNNSIISNKPNSSKK